MSVIVRNLTLERVTLHTVEKLDAYLMNHMEIALARMGRVVQVIDAPVEVEPS